MINDASFDYNYFYFKGIFENSVKFIYIFKILKFWNFFTLLLSKNELSKFFNEKVQTNPQLIY